MSFSVIQSERLIELGLKTVLMLRNGNEGRFRILMYMYEICNFSSTELYRKRGAKKVQGLSYIPST